MVKSPITPARVKAWTLVELLVAIGVAALLIATAAGLFGTFMERARRAKCISHMRSLHTGLLAYTTDKGHWPQMEEGEFEFTEEEFFGFWIEETSPYGLSQETWVCPSDRAVERMLNEGKVRYWGTYVVTRFDRKPQTPFRWNQPWAIERGNFHGQGAHILLPDGSVQPTQNPFFGR